MSRSTTAIALPYPSPGEALSHLQRFAGDLGVIQHDLSGMLKVADYGPPREHWRYVPVSGSTPSGSE